MRTFGPLLCALLLAPCLGAKPRLTTEPSTLVYPDFWHTPLGLHRGTPRLLRLMLGEAVRFDDPMGVAAVRMAELGPQQGPELTAFGVNSGAGQIVFNPSMRRLDFIGQAGGGWGRFYRPVGVAAHPSGRVAVADSGNHRVVLLRYSQGRLEWEGTLGSRGRGPGEFENPRWVALDSQMRLYVSDTGNNRVQVFGQDGGFLLEFGGDPDANNSLLEPQAIAVVDPLEPYSAEPGRAGIYVVDQYHGRIQRFSLDGRFLGQVTAADLGRPAVYFQGLALDYFNNVWVTDRSTDQVHKFDRQLQFLDSWGGTGDGDGRFRSPRGIAITRHFGQVLVLEREAAQYLWVGADVRDISFHRVDDPVIGPQLRLDYFLTERAWVDAWVEGLQGERLATLAKRKLQKQGGQSVFWNGDLDSGYRILPGPYMLVFQVEATYSSATYTKKELRRRFVVK